MRRMRDFSLGHYVVFAVPALAAALGIQYAIRHHTPSKGKAELADTLKPSQLKEPAGAHSSKSSKGQASRSVASNDASSHSAHKSESAPHESHAENRHAAESHPKENPTHHSSRSSGHRESDSDKLVAAAVDTASSGTACAAIEFAGEGPKMTRVTKDEWAKVMSQFHQAKGALVAWIDKHRSELPEKTAQIMEKQARGIKIQRPPSIEEPDLAWRGIGVYSQTQEGEPLIRLGGGFVKLAHKNPTRAKFEITRLVAQAWSPCELQRLGASGTWSPLLQCLKITEAQSCAPGSYSEGGWAVSSTVATSIAGPGCDIPIFKNAEFAQCFKKIPLSVTTASSENAPKIELATKEGR